MKKTKENRKRKGPKPFDRTVLREWNQASQAANIADCQILQHGGTAEAILF